MGCKVFEDSKHFSVFLLGCSIIAVLFQSVGLFTLGWVRLTHADSDIDIGLWSVEACNEQEGTFVCQSFSSNELTELLEAKSNTEARKVFTDYFIEEIHKSRALATVACLAAVFGLVSTIVLCTSLNTVSFTIQFRRLICCVLWLISAVFILSAVICSSQFNEMLTYSAEFNKALGKVVPETRFPWSLLFSGFGMLFSGISCSLVAYLMCFNKSFSSTGDIEGQTAESRTVSKGFPNRTYM